MNEIDYPSLKITISHFINIEDFYELFAQQVTEFLKNFSKEIAEDALTRSFHKFTDIYDILSDLPDFKLYIVIY
jgi:hypothetical protein